MRPIPLLTRINADVKIRIKGAMPGWLVSRARPNTIRVVRRPSTVLHGRVPVYALVSTWCEADIAHAVVEHTLEQGVDRVFLLDNASTDATVPEAEAAGASLVGSFSTDAYDELLRCDLINVLIDRISRAQRVEKMWWLVADADEFISAPRGLLLPEFLSELDDTIRVVGARVFDHFPTPGVRYETRSNPIDTQPMCREKRDHRCELGHHKHPVFLWDAARRPIEIEPGCHQVRCPGEALYEPNDSLFMHHFPFRNEADARRRLSALLARGVTDDSRAANADGHIKARYASIDAVYKGRYDRVLDYRSGRLGVKLTDWYETDAYLESG